MRSGMSVPAATMLPVPTTAPFKIVARIPMRQRDSMVQPCSTTAWPTVMSSPKISGHSSFITWSTEPSCTLVRAAMRT